jgi:predicted transcriptional regulator
MSQHTMGVSAKFSPQLLNRLDSIAAAWGLDRSATLRRLVETVDVEAAAPLAVPSMGELIAIASEKARGEI